MSLILHARFHYWNDRMSNPLTDAHKRSLINGQYLVSS
ncbi:hypothetical protein SAMN05216600_10619 [Pseudomonas cuatrocienegasensis]|uniref:Uncharacterized protein n=1 Tax=Pseudomonas cuatrocienegasensis TaxID=543360 RepID=A0ABY1BBE2_9PSED|nr:hypothetical protein SAMN05216600_10619 [Pseudomonas cuatrocienegasensis]